MQPSSTPQSPTDARGIRRWVDGLLCSSLDTLTDPFQLVEKMGQTIALEAQTLGVNQLFAPVVDLARELRYGRVSINQELQTNADCKHADD